MAEKIHPMEKYRDKIKPALTSKVEEFHMLGFERTTEDELWDCLMKKKWKKREEKQLYQIVNDVLTISINDYMNYISMKALSAEDLLPG